MSTPDGEFKAECFPGARALYNNTVGSSNTATGVQALQNNTTGGYNTASGAGGPLSTPHLF